MKKKPVLKFVKVSSKDEPNGVGIPLAQSEDDGHQLFLLPPPESGMCPCLMVAKPKYSYTDEHGYKEHYSFLNVEDKTLRQMVKVLQSYLRASRRGRILPQVSRET